MKLYFLTTPLSLIPKERITFSVWTILLLFGSLAGLFVLKGNENFLDLYKLSGSFYITCISLSAAFIYDTVIGPLDDFRNEDKMKDTFPLQILLLVCYVIIIFFASIEFKNLIFIEDIEERKVEIGVQYQLTTFIITLLLGVYTYGVNRLKNYPELMIQLKFLDKVKKTKTTKNGEDL